MLEKIQIIKSYIDSIEEDIKRNPNIEAIDKLINVCTKLDERYKEWCSEVDDDFNDEEGTAYNEGVSMEFYIESSDWHQISLALRELEETGNEK